VAHRPTWGAPTTGPTPRLCQLDVCKLDATRTHWRCSESLSHNSCSGLASLVRVVETP
jgi:hypothetical protein